MNRFFYDRYSISDRFSISEEANGELAVREMSEKAQQGYDSDIITVYKYVDDNATYELEQAAEEAGIEDDIPNVVRFAIRCDEQLFVGLTFEEAERWLESYADALNWEDA